MLRWLVAIFTKKILRCTFTEIKGLIVIQKKGFLDMFLSFRDEFWRVESHVNPAILTKLSFILLNYLLIPPISLQRQWVFMLMYLTSRKTNVFK